MGQVLHGCATTHSASSPQRRHLLRNVGRRQLNRILLWRRLIRWWIYRLLVWQRGRDFGRIWIGHGGSWWG